MDPQLPPAGRPAPTGIARAAAVGIAIAGAVLAACAPAPSDESALARLRREGTARVGYANEAPYAYLEPATGRVTGEAPEIARAVLGELGVERVEGVLTEFGSLIPGLRAGRFDVIAAGMYVTPERCARVAFSEPTYCIGEAFVVAAGNPLGLHGYGDVATHAEARLGVVAGTVERGIARDLGVPDERVVVFPDAPSALAGVEADRVDAYAGTALTVNDLLAKADSTTVERAEPFEQPVVDGEVVRGCGAFAFRPGDTDLRDAFDGVLREWIGSEEHLERVAPFGFGPAEVPGDVTTAELCSG